MIACGACGTDLPDEFRFCEECGAARNPCTTCGHANDGAFRFCEECGESLAASVIADSNVETDSVGVDSQVLTCRFCEQSNPIDHRFCEECGASLAAEVVGAPGAEPAAEDEAVPQSEGQPPSATEAAVGASQETAAMAPCSTCRHPNPPNYQFCEECGAGLGTPDSGTWRRVVAAVAAAVMVVAGAVALWPDRSGAESSGESSAVEIDGVVAPNTPVDQALMTLDVTDLDLDLTGGLEIGLDDGSQYEFDGSRWTAYVDTGDGAIHQSRLGFVAGAFRPDGDVLRWISDRGAPEATVSWAEWVLTDTPGVERSGGSWVLTDMEAFLAVLESQPNGGTWVYDDASGRAVLFDDTEMQLMHFLAADGYTWFVDEVGARAWLLVVDAGGEQVAAGVLSDSAGGYLFEDSANLDSTAVANRQRALESAGLSGLAAGADSGPVAVGPHPASRMWFGWPCCEILKKVPGVETVTSGVSSIITNVRSGVGGAYDVGAGIVTLDAGRIVDGVKDIGGAYIDQRVLWPVEQIGDLFPISTKIDCGLPGPGHLGSGAGRPVYLDQYEGQYAGTMASGRIDMVNLARAWMPAIKLSNHEECGHIRRILARVYATTPAGNPAPTLAEAAHVQITYSVMFDRDGGAAFTIGSHTGDNEGFSIGLTRSTRMDGRCGLSDPQFELVGGKSAAHKNAAGGIVKLEEDQISAGAWAGPCPGVPPTWGTGLPPVDSMATSARGGDDYFVWVSVSKHGIYFSEGRCDVALRRFEECHEGRQPFDLSRWVELIEFDLFDLATCSKDAAGNEAAAPASWPPLDQQYALNGGWSSYLCAARHAGPNYDVPGLLEAAYAPVPEAEQIPRLDIQVPDVVGDTPEVAQRTLEALGLVVQFYVDRPVVTDPEDAGRIVEQEPAAGSFVANSTTIRLTIGGDVELVEVPNVIGDSRTTAERAIERAGLVAAYSGQETVDPGSSLVDRVAVQSPEAGGLVEPGSVVNFWVGIANEAIVPDLIGETRSGAMTELGRIGLDLVEVGTIEVGVSSGRVGKVAWQQPAAGSRVPLGSTVSVRIGVAPDLVNVPCFEGLLLDDAYDSAASGGIDLRVSGYVERESNAYFDDRVDNQSIPCGSEVERGTTVWVEVESANEDYSSPDPDPDPGGYDAIRMELTWSGPADFDLKVYTPSGAEVDRVSSAEGGEHLGDTGSCSSSDSYEEVIVWEGDSAPTGIYTAEVVTYCSGSLVEWQLKVLTGYNGALDGAVFEYGDSNDPIIFFGFEY